MPLTRNTAHLILQGGEVETGNVPESTDKISPDVTEDIKDKATMIETEEQAEEPQSQLQKEQQKTITGTQPQRVEDTSTTTTHV